MAVKTGTENADFLNDNFINGFAGPIDFGTDDFVIGLAGDDTITLHNGNDTADGGAGADTFRDRAGGDDTMQGGDDADTFFAGSGNNLIDGGAGFSGRRGFDRDTVSYENSSTEARVNLAVGSGTGDGTDTLIGIENVRGSALADGIAGDLGNNALFGLDGNDSMAGQDGNDRLFGDNGADSLLGDRGDDSIDGGLDSDLLLGGRGRDVLTGGRGSDKLVFQSQAESRAANGIDLITDFLRGEDKIDLSTIDANRSKAGDQAFKFVADHTNKAAGQIEATFDAGRNVTVIEAYTNKDNAADMVIELTGHVDLAKADFFL